MASSRRVALAASAFIASVVAQVPGTLTPEVHPSLISSVCTKAGGCTTVNSSIVLDSQYRWTHNVGGYTNCVDGGFNATICPDAATCAMNCAVEGVDYSTYGIATSGNALTLNLFVNKSGVVSQSSPRVYLLQNETHYDLLKLLNQEFTFDVDVSKVPCGINGALYLSEMPGDGGVGPMNTAGAKYGTGYCDAQCPKNNFVAGSPNLDFSKGACCNEMDVWEANNAAQALTPHTCNITGTYACTGALCTGSGVCDQSGCDYNPFRMGNPNFYGPGKTVDTTKLFTVVTQFITDDGTATGNLKTINRVWVQGRKVIANAPVDVSGMAKTNYIDDTYCNAEVKAFGGTSGFEQRGGMVGMGKSLARGMVLAMSIWMDSGSGMLWLDSTYPQPATPDATPAAGTPRGPCSATSGNTTMLTSMYPGAAVTFSNIKVGDINSTFMAMSM